MFKVFEVGGEAAELLALMLEMRNAMERVKAAKIEHDVANSLCKWTFIGQTDKRDAMIAHMLANNPYPGLTAENIMERAKLIAQRDAITYDFEARKVVAASFENETGQIEIIGDRTMPEVRKRFFDEANNMGFHSEADIRETFKRLESSRPAQMGMPMQHLFELDAKYKAEGHPCCPNCKVHHPPHGSEAVQDKGQDCERTLH